MKSAIQCAIGFAVLFVFALAGLSMVGALEAVCDPKKAPDPAWLEQYQNYRDPGPGPSIKQV